MRKDNQPKRNRASSKKIAAIGLPNPAPLFLVGTKRFELAAAPVLADQPDCTLLSLVSHEPVVGVFKPEGKLAWMLVPVTLLGMPNRSRASSTTERLTSVIRATWRAD
jgi:hypothetical protein